MRWLKQIIVLLFCTVLVESIATCGILSFEISKTNEGLGLTKEEVHQHIESIPINFVNPSEHLWSCVDGRSSSGILGTPGGDSGEFILALSIYQKNGGLIDSQERVLELFVNFMQSIPVSRQFYMHTDIHALEHLQEEVRSFIPNFDITDVPWQYQENVSELLLDTSNIGCGHLRLVILHPEEYEVPLNITKSFMKAYFEYMWNHENWTKLKLHSEDYEILEGNHTEQAALNIIENFPSDQNCDNQVPLIVPRTRLNSFFVNHPIAVGAFRDQLTKFFSNQIGGISAIEMRSQMDILAKKQLNLTLSYLATSKPRFVVNFIIEEVVETFFSDSPAWVGVFVVFWIVVLIIGGTYLAWYVNMNGWPNIRNQIHRLFVRHPEGISFIRIPADDSESSEQVELEETRIGVDDQSNTIQIQEDKTKIQTNSKVEEQPLIMIDSVV